MTMKPSRLSRFFYLLLIVALLAVSVVWMRDLTVVVILAALQLNEYLLPLLVKRDTRRRGWTLWACAFCALALTCRLADVFLMPVHTPPHGREVIAVSLISMVCGLAAAYYAPSARARAAP